LLFHVSPNTGGIRAWCGGGARGAGGDPGPVTLHFHDFRCERLVVFVVFVDTLESAIKLSASINIRFW